MKTVLIADDHEIVRHGIRTIMDGLPEQCNCIEVSARSELMQSLFAQQVDFLILDIFLEDGSILSSIEHIIQQYPKMHILVYSMNAEHIYANRLIRQGVRGFVSKRASLSELEKAIRIVLAGEIYLSSTFKETLLQPKTANVQNPIHLLSNRELEVAEYVVMGMATKEVAEKMSLDITTVSTYRRRVLQKLGVENTFALKEKFMLYKT